MERRETAYLDGESVIFMQATNNAVEKLELNVSDDAKQVQPFPHFYAADAIPNEFGVAALSWLETEAPWRYRVEIDFYEAFVLDLTKIQLPPALFALTAPATLASFRETIERLFQVTLAARVDVRAHKMTAGFLMGPHTDAGYLTRSHRLVIQLNQGWLPTSGGRLRLHFNRDRETDCLLYLPEPRSCVAFEISPRSYHSVEQVVQGERYTISFSFYRRDES